MYSTPLAYVLWFFFGIFGVHRFYCGRIATGVLWLLTGGLLGIGWLIDVFLIPGMVDDANHRISTFPPPVGEAYIVPTGEGTPAPSHAGPKRVIYCTRCGGALMVPHNATGRQYSCPRCWAVLRVPA